MREPHFSVFRFPVRVEVWFFVIIGIIGLQRSWLPAEYIVEWFAVAFVSVLVHELGHAFAFRRLGQEPRIQLTGLVGLTYGSAPFRTRRDDIVTSLAGPFTALAVLGVPAFAASKLLTFDSLFPAVLVRDLYWISFVWSFVNLLPILPLDGGHVVQAVWGRGVARRVSVVAAVVSFVVLLYLGYNFLLFLLLLGGLSAYEIYLETRGGGSGRPVLPPSPGEYGGGYGGGEYGPPPSRQQLRAGRQRGKAARKRTRLDRAHLRAVPDTPAELVDDARPAASDIAKVESVVWSAIREGDLDAARRALAKLPAGGATDPFLRPAFDLVDGEEARALAGFEAAYVARPEGPSGLLPATLLGQHGQARSLAVRLLGHQGGGPAFAVSGLQGHLHYSRHFAQSATVGELLFADTRSNKAQVAFEVACAWCRAGRVDEALAWIGRAVDAGFDSGATLDREEDLAAARQDPAWTTVRARIA